VQNNLQEFLKNALSCNIRVPFIKISGESMDISGKVALITGGASGLGLATAEKLLAAGSKIMLVDLNEDNAKKAVESLGDGTAFAIANVTDEDSVTDSIKATIEQFGGIHIVVNCAGIGSASKTVGKDGAHPLQYFKTVVDINLIGTFNVLRLAAVEMGNNEPGEDGECGVIVNTASVAAFDGQIGQAGYSASKAGVVGMTLPIARDLARMGIRVNTIAPGIFDTPMMAMASDQVRGPLIEMTQFPKRLGLPQEYASLVKHIVENTFLNGETIRLDGGIRMAPK
jgi:NAD(P)-dependent dehydrogenase (short-subunit alcohol dehydrogenase family)